MANAKYLMSSTKEICNIIGKKNEKLAELTGNILFPTMEELNRKENEITERIPIFNGLSDKIRERAGQKGNINRCPSDIKGPCRPICIFEAFNVWDSKSRIENQPGFEKVVNESIPQYLMSCGETNEANLILTTAWDEKYFIIHRLKEKLDQYSKTYNITIGVILLTGINVSLQYLR